MIRLAKFDAAGVALLIGAPLAIGLLLGWGRAGQLAPHLGHGGSLGYWLGFSLGIWLLMALCSHGVAWLAGRWLRSVALIALLGGMIATLLTRPFAVTYGNLVVELAGVVLPDRGRTLPLLPGSAGQVGLGIVLSAEWIGIWVAANLFYFHVLGRTRFDLTKLRAQATAALNAGIAPAAAASTAIEPTSTPVAGAASTAEADIGTTSVDARAGSTPAFLNRARKPLGTELLAMQAQDHYVRVYTRLGDELLLHRFTDAVREVGDRAGIRVHRSWWIAIGAIRRIVQRGPRVSVELDTGLRVPVSRTFLEDLRRRVVQRDVEAATAAAPQRPSLVDAPSRPPATVATLVEKPLRAATSASESYASTAGDAPRLRA